MLEKSEKLLGLKRAKITDLSNNLVDHTQKLKVTSAFTLKRDILAKEAKEQVQLVEEWVMLAKKQ